MRSRRLAQPARPLANSSIHSQRAKKRPEISRAWQSTPSPARCSARRSLRLRPSIRAIHNRSCWSGLTTVICETCWRSRARSVGHLPPGRPHRDCSESAFSRPRHRPSHLRFTTIPEGSFTPHVHPGSIREHQALIRDCGARLAPSYLGWRQRTARLAPSRSAPPLHPTCCRSPCRRHASAGADPTLAERIWLADTAQQEYAWPRRNPPAASTLGESQHARRHARRAGGSSTGAHRRAIAIHAGARPRPLSLDLGVSLASRSTWRDGRRGHPRAADHLRWTRPRRVREILGWRAWDARFEEAIQALERAVSVSARIP